jgi:hypothetical protein
MRALDLEGNRYNVVISSSVIRKIKGRGRQSEIFAVSKLYVPRLITAHKDDHSGTFFFLLDLAYLHVTLLPKEEGVKPISPTP